MNLWNIKNLDMPPRNTYKAKSQDIDISTLREVVGEAYSTFKNDKSFKEEAAILSRTIYRMKLKFRNDKGFKAMEKTNRALLQYLRMDIPQMLETFYGMIPHKYGYDTYLPTLNMLHYVLIRIQGLAKLMIRVVECAKTAALFMESRVSIGHLWKVAFICFTVVSKIFVLSKQLTKFCCKFYSQLHPFTKALKNVGVQWLPSEYVLPNDLKLWLDVDWLDKDDVSIPKPKKMKIPTVFDIIESDSDVEFRGEYTEIKDDDDVDFVNEYLEVDKSRKDKLGMREILLESDTELTAVKIQEDMGEVVKRVEKNVKAKKKRNKRKKSQHLIGEAKIAKLNESTQVNQSKENMNSQIDKESKRENNNIVIQKRKKGIGEVVKSTNTNSVKQKNKKKKTKSVNIVHLLEEIATLKDLKKFEKRFDKLQQEYPSSFRNTDKLQRNMLHCSLKKCINKAMKNCSDPLKVDSYVIKAKNVLKSSLL
ncbi:hypothetical protein ILUMI_00724 [Ignelater luminosus]|uniref:Nucleolus and neural progenitor protein-like N-terminal domain-containing protein n=1 Tax=Ignelater luminosus TaxID=2038154 RepID=A0A8K0DLB7_IGNLU|nr:hypothetical protein ILUMI_00724 [Ignelater luminosus]